MRLLLSCLPGASNVSRELTLARVPRLGCVADGIVPRLHVPAPNPCQQLPRVLVERA
jgi:hypothetical protein